MKQLVQEKALAIKMRNDGLSYRQILERIPVSKSTLSSWLGKLELSPEIQNKLFHNCNSRQEQGRIIAGQKNKERRIIRESAIKNEAKIEFDIHKTRSDFLVGVALYWAEGGKKSGVFQFINSDSEMIQYMLVWIGEYLGIPKESLKIRLFIHEPYKNENCERHWSERINIPVDSFQKTIYKPTPHKIKIRPYYKGCLRISCGGVDLLRKVMFWRDFLVQEQKKMHP